MSSHHFVREGQEPALFILENIAFQQAESLLEWVPLVMVADAALEKVLQWRIKIDVVLQYRHPPETIELLIKDQGPVQIVSGDDHVVEAGLRYLAENDFEAVNILSTSHEAIFEEVERSAHTLQVGIYDGHQKWSLIKSGKFEKWMPAASTLLIRSTQSFQTDGLVQTGEFWESPGPGIVTVRSETAFWVGEGH